MDPFPPKVCGHRNPQLTISLNQPFENFISPKILRLPKNFYIILCSHLSQTKLPEHRGLGEKARVTSSLEAHRLFSCRKEAHEDLVV